MASLINGAPPPFPVLRPEDQRLTTADAYTSTKDTIGDWVAAQRADAVAQGLWDPETGMPTQKGLINAAQQYSGALMAGTSAPEGGGIRAYHGSPHDFERFDTSKIGTGEGAQAYGHGLYFAGNEAVAKGYRDTLSAIPPDAFGDARALLGSAKGDFQAAIQENKSMWKDPDSRHAKQVENILNHWEQNGVSNDTPASGKMYEVNINANPEHFLDWDKPLSEQSPAVRDRLSALMQAHQVPRKNNAGGETTGGQLYSYLQDKFGGDQAASAEAAKELHGEGVSGIRYLDGGSRASGEGTSNHVVFDADAIEIMKKYGLAGLITGAGAASAAGDKSQ
jgi:hypothetical protein